MGSDKKVYSIVYISEGNRIVESATSITGMKKILKTVTNYRIYDETGKDVTGEFKRKGLR